MRQAGILAACGIVSLNQMVDRLADDHGRARQLAEAVDRLPGLSVDHATVQTNMVLIQTDGPSEPWLNGLREHGVWALPPAPDRIRLVLHKDIDDDAVQHAVRAFAAVAEELMGVA